MEERGSQKLHETESKKTLPGLGRGREASQLTSPTLPNTQGPKDTALIGLLGRSQEILRKATNTKEQDNKIMGKEQKGQLKRHLLTQILVPLPRG